MSLNQQAKRQKSFEFRVKAGARRIISFGLVIGAILGVAVGFTIGYGMGFEQAVESGIDILTNYDPSHIAEFLLDYKEYGLRGALAR